MESRNWHTADETHKTARLSLESCWKTVCTSQAAAFGKETKISLDRVQTLACFRRGGSTLQEEFVWSCDVGVKAAECTYDRRSDQGSRL